MSHLLTGAKAEEDTEEPQDSEFREAIVDNEINHYSTFQHKNSSFPFLFLGCAIFREMMLNLDE